MNVRIGLGDFNEVMRRVLGEEWKDVTKEDIARETEKLLKLRKQAPYPWCPGDPTIQDCINRGYCRRDPNCGD